jgi:MGT family glycosyltransferase
MRALIATVPETGHVNPALPVARELSRRGHEVRWYTGRNHRAAIEATGAAFDPIDAAHDPADRPFQERLPARAGLDGLAALRFDLKHLFFDEVPLQLEDLRRILARFPADVVLADTAFLAAPVLHEQGGPPFATLGISVLPVPSRDLPPVGTGRPPSPSPLGRARDRLLSTVAQRVLFRDVQRHHQQVRAGLGLPPTERTVFDLFVSPYLYLHGATPGFEYPRRDLPAQVHFVGPLLPEPPPDALPWAPRGDRPVVLVTQGTVATDPGELIAPALEALADQDVTVIATGSGVAGWDRPVPPNAEVHGFVPFASLMPHVAVMITNGGFGGVQSALAHGVPLVVVGATEDKPEVGARVAWSGVGRHLRTRTPSPGQLRDAARSVLTNPSYRHRAEAIRDEIAATDPAASAADLVEALAHTRAPVLRRAGDPVPEVGP